MKVLISSLVLVLSLVFSVSVAAEIQKEKFDKIVELMQVINADEFISPEYFYQSSLDSIPKDKKISPKKLEEGKAQIKRIVSKIDYDQLKYNVALVYDTHYSTEEINQLIAFYKSPVGQKSILKQYQIVEDSKAAGRLAALKAIDVIKKEDEASKKAK